MQADPVMPLRDPTSDMAVIARAGSKLVKDIREKKEASKSRKRFWEMAGSKMGKITGARGRAGRRPAAAACAGWGIPERPLRGGSAPSGCASRRQGAEHPCPQGSAGRSMARGAPGGHPCGHMLGVLDRHTDACSDARSQGACRPGRGMHDRGRRGAPGLTTEEEEEGKRAKAALEAGEGGEGDEDGEGGDYKERGKFFTHLKKTEARTRAWRARGGRARGGRRALRGAAARRAPPGPAAPA